MLLVGLCIARWLAIVQLRRRVRHLLMWLLLVVLVVLSPVYRREGKLLHRQRGVFREPTNSTCQPTRRLRRGGPHHSHSHLRLRPSVPCFQLVQCCQHAARFQLRGGTGTGNGARRLQRCPSAANNNISRLRDAPDADLGCPTCLITRPIAPICIP